MTTEKVCFTFSHHLVLCYEKHVYVNKNHNLPLSAHIA